MKYGYARVSSDGQSVDAQVRQLTKAGCKKVFREVASGAKTDRAQLRRLLDQLEADDVLMVTRLDRLARSTRDLLNTLATITAKKAGFKSLGDRWADEGFYPESHMRAFEPILQKAIDDSRAARNQLASLFPFADLSHLDDIIDTQIVVMQKSVEKSRLKLGVSCWHRNDFESEAMWRLYSASEPLIAVESTIARLYNSIMTGKKVIIDNVRYVDCENSPIEKGHKHYGLFLKRKSFEHEREVRATILLDEEGKGELVNCALETLVYKIHISPFAPAHFYEAVRWICAGISKPICQSTLFTKPPTPLNLR